VCVVEFFFLFPPNMPTLSGIPSFPPRILLTRCADPFGYPSFPPALHILVPFHLYFRPPPPTPFSCLDDNKAFSSML